MHSTGKCLTLTKPSRPKRSFFSRISLKAFHPQENFIKTSASQSDSQKYLKLHFVEQLGLQNHLRENIS